MSRRRLPAVKPWAKMNARQGFFFQEFELVSRFWKNKSRMMPFRNPKADNGSGLKLQILVPYARRNVAQPLRGYVVCDAMALIVAFFAAWLVASALNHHYFNRQLYKPETTDAMVRAVQYIALSCGVLLNLERQGHYRLHMPFWLEARGILTTLGVALMIDGFLQFAIKQDFSRLSLVLSWALAGLLMIGARSVFRLVMRRRGLWRVPTLLVGAGATAEDALAALGSDPGLGFDITAHVEDLPAAFDDAGRSWEEMCALYHVDYVLIALEGMDLAQAEKPIAQLLREGIPFSVAPPMRHMPVFGMVPHYFLNHDVMLLTPSRGLEQFLPRLIKRVFDIIASGVALMLLSPVALVLALVVKSDGGSAFYGHKRIGFNGKPFACLKFRTMMPSGDEILEGHLASHPEAAIEWHRERKLRNDPRITRFGKFLRANSLDELPQLLNVFRGDMSLVGPRPIVMDETKKYKDDIAYYYRVRPGITGLWQVSGRNDVAYGKRVHMDIWYVRNWSLWHDIAILCKTFPVLLMRAGAY